MALSNPILSKEEKKLAILKAQQAREKIFKLVVKIISWETASMDSIVIRSGDKITSQEWAKYRNHLLDISKTEGIDKVKSKLAASYQAIKENSGFK